MVGKRNRSVNYNELVLIPKAEYEKLLLDNQTRHSSIDSSIPVQNINRTDNESISSNSSFNSVHTNVNESARDVNKPYPKELVLLLKPVTRTAEQINADHNSDPKINRVKSHSRKVVSSRKPNQNKSNSEQKMHDQSGGQQTHRKYVKQTFTEFLGNKRRPRWIPYKI